ncbi:HSP70-1 [Ramazzottius varieornatus]|uniref:HSP70-1 n=1 Tax=Ramazzottius varieornatus TaxID=947166 RepID=A0A1D1UFB0_RAMVA|nr:HSP70-1 [Ramazzottius varieornatus]
MSGSLAVGFSFGLAYSSVAVYQNRRVEVIANEQGHRLTPTCVAFTDTELLVGDAAKSQVATNAENTIFDIKRMIGKKFSDAELQEDVKRWPFTVGGGKEDEPVVKVTFKEAEHEYNPVQLSGMVLTELKKTAEAYLGSTVTECVVAVPSYFTDVQRRNMVEAGKLASLKVLRVVNEAFAAAMAYDLERKDDAKKVLIFDVGGGTLDVSVLSVEDGRFEVLAMAGDLHLGGEDFDQRLVKFYAQEFQKKHKKDASKNARSMRRLKAACELAKRSLSMNNQATMEVDSLFEGIDYFAGITRARLEELCGDQFRIAVCAIDKALADAKLDKSAIDEVVLVGGSSRIPRLQKLVQDYFDGKEPLKSINLDEVIVYGAALQAAVLTGQREGTGEELLKDDMTLLTIGIETAGSLTTSVIHRHAPLPVKGSHIVTTSFDNQSTVVIHLLEGERAAVSDNRSLGKLELSELPAMPRGALRIDVQVQVDSQHLLTATATEPTSGRSAAFSLQLANSRFKKGELKNMVREADESFDADEVQRELVGMTNALMSLTSNILFVLEDEVFAARVSKEDRDLLLEQCSAVSSWLLNPELSKDDVEEKQRELEEAFREVLDRVYEADQDAFSSVAVSYGSETPTTGTPAKKGKTVKA